MLEIAGSNLTDLAAEIGRLYRRGLEDWLEAGRLLKIQKEQLTHGQWLPWLRDNREALGFGIRAAQYLIKLASNTNPSSHLDSYGRVRGTQGTGDNEWHTPDQYLDLARKVLGGIDLDPASHKQAQERVKAKRFLTTSEDGLAEQWHGRIWLNPPYAQPLITQFVQKLIEQYEARRVTEAIMLTHNYTDTEWFHLAVSRANAICFTRGRIRFVDLNGDQAAPTQGQAFFYFGSRSITFAEKFSEIGFVAVPYRKDAAWDQMWAGKFYGTSR